MDILRKMFKTTYADEAQQSAKATENDVKNEFRKPQWFEEVETDDELFDDDRKFAFQVFTNPLELQKHFEQQLQQVLETFRDFEGNDIPVEKNLKDEFLKPGFESAGSLLKEFEKHKDNMVDTDLDGEIYADQLHSLIQGLKADEPLPNILPRNDKFKGGIGPKTLKTKLTDDERIMAAIHGTLQLNDDDNRSKAIASARESGARMKPDIMTPMTPMMPRNNGTAGGGGGGGVFDGIYQGPKMFSQSILMKTIRKPDGSYETTKVTQDAQGNRVTTVTRTKDGKTETITNYDGVEGNGKNNMLALQPKGGNIVAEGNSSGNFYVTKEGYAMPRNLW